ncbi:unnamed protein product [Brassica oleracea]
MELRRDGGEWSIRGSSAKDGGESFDMGSKYEFGNWGAGFISSLSPLPRFGEAFLWFWCRSWGQRGLLE